MTKLLPNLSVVWFRAQLHCHPAVSLHINHCVVKIKDDQVSALLLVKLRNHFYIDCLVLLHHQLVFMAFGMNYLLIDGKL
mgnify:CR=1 FL=1